MPYREAAKALLRETVVDAMRGLLETRAWPDVTMSEVAAAAGVSRQTLYNEFGGRDGLAASYAQVVAAAFLDEVERVVLANADDPEAAFLRAFELFLDEAHSHPMVRAVEAISGIDGVAAFVAAEPGRQVVVGASARLMDLIIGLLPDVPPEEAGIAAEALVRLAVSHLTVPTWPPAEAARRTWALGRPLLQELQARTPSA